MLTSVVNYDSSVKAHVSNTSDHSLYSGICWLHNCVFGWSISEKNGQKLFYLFINGIVHWFEECSFGVVYVTQYFSFDIPYNAQIPII